MSAELSHWLTRLIVRELEAFERELALCPDERVVWCVAPGITNAIGTLVLHVCGNLQYFVGARLGGSGYVRNREAEFARTGVAREALVAELRRTRNVVATTLARVTEEQLSQPFPEPVGGATLTTGLFLTHLAAHLAFHLGQAGYLRRLLTGDTRSAGPLPLSAL
ncbi:MAG: DinB family protein [Vicinamibacterales bacterium]